MICFNYLFVGCLCVGFFGSNYGYDVSDNIFVNGGFKMESGNEEMVCTVTCIKNDKPSSSPCDQGGSTTTTKTPCPMANTTTTLPSTTPPSTAPTMPPSTPSSTTLLTLPSTLSTTPSTSPSTPPTRQSAPASTPSTPHPTLKSTLSTVPSNPPTSTPPSITLSASPSTTSARPSSPPTAQPASTTVITSLLPTSHPSTTLLPSSTLTSSTTTNPPTTQMSTTTVPTPPSATCGNKTKTICAGGDPHYATWDQAFFDYHGSCPYNFVSPCKPNSIVGFENFSIKAQNKLVVTKPSPIAIIDSIQFEMYQQKIYISALGDLYVNNRREFYTYYYPNATNPKITIRQNGVLRTIETASGINLQMNGPSVCVTIPDCAPFYGKDKLCGLGGNYDGVCSNDLVYKNGTSASSNTQCRHGNSVSDWANSFVVTDYFYPANASKNCELGSNAPACDTTKSKVACKPISDAVIGTGVFQQCKAMGNDVIDRMFQNCAADVCMIQDFLCKSLEDFARECQRMLNGTNLGPWRAPLGCPEVQCPANSVFKPCVLACQPTCKDLPHLTAACGSNACMEGCQCNDGYVIDSTKTTFTCIKTEECGCFDESSVYRTSKNDPWITNSCKTFNTCWHGKQVRRIFECDPAEECITTFSFIYHCYNSKCPLYWRYFSKTGACYRTIYNVTFDEAKSRCQAMGAQLTSINSVEENDFLRNMVRMGIINVQLVENTYIGLSGMNEMKWIDGSPLNYTNEAENPNPFSIENNVDKYCWAMVSDAGSPQTPILPGKWHKTNCDRVFRTAVCKKL